MNEEKLSSLPNIGKELEKQLNAAGINTPDELRQIGTQQAFLRLNITDPDSCYSKLCAIEGAIQGIRWHNLDKSSKEELKHFLNVLHLNDKRVK